MLITLLILGLIALYLFMAFVTFVMIIFYRVLTNSNTKKTRRTIDGDMIEFYECEDPDIIFGSLFWPIGLPITLFTLAAHFALPTINKIVEKING